MEWRFYRSRYTMDQWPQRYTASHWPALVVRVTQTAHRKAAIHWTDRQMPRVPLHSTSYPQNIQWHFPSKYLNRWHVVKREKSREMSCCWSNWSEVTNSKWFSSHSTTWHHVVMLGLLQITEWLVTKWDILKTCKNEKYSTKSHDAEWLECEVKCFQKTPKWVTNHEFTQNLWRIMVKSSIFYNMTTCQVTWELQKTVRSLHDRTK